MNILEILKSAPKDTKLYSPAFGEVKFKAVYNGKVLTIDSADIERAFYSTGNFYKDGECMLFPSRENRDWNTFEICPFKDGDILMSKAGNPFIFKMVMDESCAVYCGIDSTDKLCIDSDNWTLISGARKATKEEIEKFVKRLKEEGYEWHSDTLTFKKIEKFDITTLKPFDKVLVRNKDIYLWKCDFYSNYGYGCKYRCVSDYFNQCIPYNNDTKHLVGTNYDCDDFYKTWGDEIDEDLLY